jgi:hypothetical protein
MRKKLMGILACVMMLATILPITAIAADSTSHRNSTGMFDHTTIRGIVLFKRTSEGGKNIHFFAIRVHYSTIRLSGEHENGLIKMEPIVIPSDMNGMYSHLYIFASFHGVIQH